MVAAVVPAPHITFMIATAIVTTAMMVMKKSPVLVMDMASMSSSAGGRVVVRALGAPGRADPPAVNGRAVVAIFFCCC